MTTPGVRPGSSAVLVMRGIHVSAHVYRLRKRDDCSRNSISDSPIPAGNMPAPPAAACALTMSPWQTVAVAMGCGSTPVYNGSDVVAEELECGEEAWSWCREGLRKRSPPQSVEASAARRAGCAPGVKADRS